MKQISNYDFTGKRVRFHGECMTKFDLSYHISHLTSYVLPKLLNIYNPHVLQ